MSIRTIRHDIIEILDGNHSRFGKGVAFSINGLILISAVAISLETVPGLKAPWPQLLHYLEIFIVLVFLLEYVLRILCSQHPVRYIFSFWGMVDLLACLPALTLIQPQWQVVRSLRLIRLVRLLKLFRTSQALDRLFHALEEVRAELLVFGVFSGLMLYISSVGIYLFEHEVQPDVFTSIPESMWWAVASFTTVGYGDMVPITTGGRIFTTVVLFIGLGVVAVPSAIVTAALLEEQTTIKALKKTKRKAKHKPVKADFAALKRLNTEVISEEKSDESS